jgi:hypothetical protein
MNYVIDILILGVFKFKQIQINKQNDPEKKIQNSKKPIFFNVFECALVKTAGLNFGFDFLKSVEIKPNGLNYTLKVAMLTGDYLFIFLLV